MLEVDSEPLHIRPRSVKMPRPRGRLQHTGSSFSLASAAAAPRARIHEIAIVSGRPVEFLRREVPVQGAVLLGQYGIEREGPGIEPVVGSDLLCK